MLRAFKLKDNPARRLPDRDDVILPVAKLLDFAVSASGEYAYMPRLSNEYC